MSKARGRVARDDLANLELENDWLIKTCRDYVEALVRAGSALGLEGWVVVSECSGVLLRVAPMEPPERGAETRERGYRPEPGQVLSLAAAGPNPIGLALDQVAVAVIPPDQETKSPAETPWPQGLGVPLGHAEVPVGCLGVLLPNHPQQAVQAVLGQALFSARAIGLALALRHERSTNLETAAGLAHEVKNPLTAVKGFLQLTLAQRNEVPEYASLALRELDRAISLLEDYSLFSRAPKITPTEPIRLDGLLSEASLLARGMTSGGPPIAVAYVDSDPDLLVLADAARLKQVFLNLCRNAVEAMPTGGVLTLRARREGSEAVVEVTDTGVGIAPSDVGLVFEPFYTTKESGTGLGLAVCRRIVEAHGGRITIESQPGRGTTAKVRLPLCLKVLEC